eukprot:6485081-Amphidinium_carterae.2
MSSASMQTTSRTTTRQTIQSDTRSFSSTFTTTCTPASIRLTILIWPHYSYFQQPMIQRQDELRVPQELTLETRSTNVARPSTAESLTAIIATWCCDHSRERHADIRDYDNTRSLYSVTNFSSLTDSQQIANYLGSYLECLRDSMQRHTLHLLHMRHLSSML